MLGYRRSVSGDFQKAAQGFADTVGKVVGVLGSGVEGLTKIMFSVQEQAIDVDGWR